MQPNSTYVVYECQTQPNGALSCAGDPNSDLLTTDASQSGRATLAFSSPPVVDHIKVINSADASEAYVANIPPNPFPALNASVSYTPNQPAIAQPAPPAGLPGPAINPLLPPYGTQGILLQG